MYLRRTINQAFIEEQCNSQLHYKLPTTCAVHTTHAFITFPVDPWQKLSILGIRGHGDLSTG